MLCMSRSAKISPMVLGWHLSACDRLASLAKPPGSLGTLEDWAATLCEVQQTLAPEASPASVLVFCADHGCKKADASLSPYPQEVTQAVFRSLAAGISATAVLTRSAGASLTVVDIGVRVCVRCVRACVRSRASVRASVRPCVLAWACRGAGVGG